MSISSVRNTKTKLSSTWFFAAKLHHTTWKEINVYIYTDCEEEDAGFGGHTKQPTFYKWEYSKKKTKE